MTHSKRKGARGERELAARLRKLLGVEARRGRQYSGVEGRDVIVDVPGVHWECKWVEALNLRRAMRQAIADAGDGEVPVVCHKRNREDWLITLRLDDMPEFCRRIAAANKTTGGESGIP